MKTIRVSKTKHVNSKSGSYGAYIRLSPKRGVKVFSEERACAYVFKSRLEVENDATYYETVNGEFQCMVKAYAKLGDSMPKPLEIVSVQVASNWYLGIIMSHVAGQTLGAKFDRELTKRGTDFKSEYLMDLSDFETWAIDHELVDLERLIARYSDLLDKARDKGVSYRDDHPWNVIYNAKTDRLTLIDFNPRFVDFPDDTTDAVLDQCFR